MKSSEGKLWRSRGGAEEEDDYMHKIMMKWNMNQDKTMSYVLEDDYMHKIMMKWNMNQDKTMSYILFKRYVAADGHHR